MWPDVTVCSVDKLYRVGMHDNMHVLFICLIMSYINNNQLLAGFNPFSAIGIPKFCPSNYFNAY